MFKKNFSTILCLLKQHSSFDLKRVISFHYLVFFVVCFSQSAQATYTMPIGIPYPGFGIDETRPQRPANWSSSIPGYYYIDYQLGNDSNNIYGTPSSPKKTIPLAIPAGSYVEVHGIYPYTSGGVTKLGGAGTSGSWIANTSGPVWIVGESQNNKPTFTQRALITGSYIYLDSLNFQFDATGETVQVGSLTAGFPANHVFIRNCTMIGDGVNRTSGIAINGSSANPVTDVIVLKNTIYNHGNMNDTSDQDAHATTVSLYSSKVWFLENTIHTCSGSGAQVGGWSEAHDPAWTHHIYYGRNENYNSRQGGLWVKYAEDVVFSENHIHDIVKTPWSPSKGMGGQYAPKRLWMLHNNIHGMEWGIRVPSTNLGTDCDIYAIGNFIYDIHTKGTFDSSSWGEAGIHIHGATNRYIINNNLHDCDAGINGSGTAGKYHIFNNRIKNISQAQGNHIYIESVGANSFFDNNILGTGDSSVKIKWGSKVYSLADFISTQNKCTECTTSEKLGSKTISEEKFAAVRSTFKELYGIDINPMIVKFMP